MEIVYAGSLESISRPSSTSSEKGRKSQLKRLQPSSSLEVLPPEDISGIPSELFSAIENDVNLEDFEDDVDGDGDNDVDISLEEEIETYKPIHDTFETEEHQSRASCTSEEEMAALTDGDIDPQIREGMEKIKKLDRILSDKIKKEKEVKNQRTQMEKMWKEQLQQMVKTHENDGSHGHRNLIGAALLALELGNEESLGSSRDDPATPIFATQPLGTEETDTYYQASTTSGSPSRGSSYSSHDEKKSQKTKNRKHGKRSRSSQAAESDRSRSNKKQTKTKEAGQDFIERNKKLAADAANVIPMTNEEKDRLERLLSIDTNEMVHNPFTDEGNLRPTQSVGFTPDEESARALADIDRKLEALVPANELELLSSRTLTETPLSATSEVSTDSHVSTKHTQENIDTVDIGERVLREEKEARHMHQRIMDIERELEQLRQISEDDTDNTISQALLAKLLNEDSRTTSSRSTIAESVMSVMSSDYLTIEDQPDDHTLTTPTTPRTVTALTDVTLTSDADTPRTLTDSLDT